MADKRGHPVWYRGPEDPSGYRASVANDLRTMRARITQEEMAEALTRELGRHIPPSSVGRWETGAALAGADVYRAYVVISNSARPSDVDAADQRLFPDIQIRRMAARVEALERQAGIQAGEDFDDAIPAVEAAGLAGVSKQTIHNLARAKKIRSARKGTHLLVSRADVIDYRDNLPRNKS